MESLLYLRDAGFIDILSILAFIVILCGTGWLVLVEVVLLHEKREISFEVGTLYNDLVFAAIFIAGECVWHKWLGRRFAGALHYAEGELNSASDGHLVCLPQTYEE